MRFEERISTDYRLLSRGGNRCPEVWRLEDGSYAVVGSDVTTQAKNDLPEDMELGEDESIVVIPKEVLESAVENL